MVPAVICLLLTFEGQVHSWAGMLWDLQWEKWRCHRLFPGYISIPLSVSFHCRSTLL